MATPHYSIEVRDAERRTICIDCGGATARVTGHRNNRPICDVCLIQQEPQLGSLIATQSTIQALAKASRPPRPAASRMLRILCEQARDLGRFFEQSWSTANDAEMKLATTYDLSIVEARARTLGGETAVQRFEDTAWVKRNIREAQEQGVNVKGYLLIAAIESVGKGVDDSSDRRALLEWEDTAVFGRRKLDSRCPAV